MHRRSATDVLEEHEQPVPERPNWPRLRSTGCLELAGERGRPTLRPVEAGLRVRAERTRRRIRCACPTRLLSQGPLGPAWPPLRMGLTEERAESRTRCPKTSPAGTPFFDDQINGIGSSSQLWEWEFQPPSPRFALRERQQALLGQFDRPGGDPPRNRHRCEPSDGYPMVGDDDGSAASNLLEKRAQIVLGDRDRGCSHSGYYSQKQMGLQARADSGCHPSSSAPPTCSRPGSPDLVSAHTTTCPAGCGNR